MSLAVEVVVEPFSECSTKSSSKVVHVVAALVLMTMLVGVTNVLLSRLLGWALVEYMPGNIKIVECCFCASC